MRCAELSFKRLWTPRFWLRHVNRQLRDHFMERAEELSTSTSESLAAAQQALRSTQESRDKRKKIVQNILNEIPKVSAQVEAIGAAG